MKKRKNRTFPIVITVLVIVIIIYLFITVEQPYIECSRITTSDMNVKISEDLKANLDNNKISRIELTKTIVIPEDLMDDKSINIKSVKYALKESYEYLGDKVKITTEENNIIIKIDITKDETVILNNISFIDNDGLQIKIDNNTKSSDVITLKVNDKYTEGELMTRLKNNGYSCK